jgi:hypothetical protein
MRPEGLGKFKVSTYTKCIMRCHLSPKGRKLRDKSKKRKDSSIPSEESVPMLRNEKSVESQVFWFTS